MSLWEAIVGESEKEQRIRELYRVIGKLEERRHWVADKEKKIYLDKIKQLEDEYMLQSARIKKES